MPKFFVHPSESYPTHHTNSGSPRMIGDEIEPVRTLLEWEAPSRPFRKKDRSYYTTIAILVTLLILIALLAHEFLLIGVILAVAFVAYVLGFVPPDNVANKISTQGVTIGDYFCMWQNLDSFWFSKKEGQMVLNIPTHLRFPTLLMLLLNDQSEDTVKETVAKYLPFHEIPPKSLMDRWSEGLQKHFPLENPHK